MNQTTIQKTGKGYSVATVGNLSTFQGKAFMKEIVSTTSMEVSFGSLAPGETVPFFHHHKQNEELYVVLSGEGVFILDGEEIAVASGSVIRIAPAVSRCTKCIGENSLIYLCIQAKDGSLEQWTMTDGVIDE